MNLTVADIKRAVDHLKLNNVDAEYFFYVPKGTEAYYQNLGYRLLRETDDGFVFAA